MNRIDTIKTKIKHIEYALPILIVAFQYQNPQNPKQTPEQFQQSLKELYFELFNLQFELFTLQQNKSLDTAQKK